MKKLISCVLALVLALSLVPSAFAAEGASVDKFTDVPADAWYRDELAYALHNGYISGTSETTFAPDALVTRGQFVTILGRMVNADVSQFKTTQFEDVNITSWYGPYVEWARSTGIVNGVSSKQFAPDNKITVEQMGVMVSNCINKLGLSPAADSVVYNDMATVSTWATFSMWEVAGYNLLPVDAAGNVNPHKQATRADCAVSLVRLAKSSGYGVVPPTVIENQTLPNEYEKAVVAKVKAIHDEMWASGKVTSSMTEKEKAIAYYMWFASNCQYGDETNYDMEAWMAHNEYGPLVIGHGVCEGLSKAYKRLLDYEGIYCEFIPVLERNHAYNAVTLDGVYYKEVDVTDIAGTQWGGKGPDMSVYINERIKQYFYPDEYRKEQESGKGFGEPLTEEEIQQLIDSLN